MPPPPRKKERYLRVAYFRERIMPIMRSEPLIMSSAGTPVLTTESRLVTAL